MSIPKSEWEREREREREISKAKTVKYQLKRLELTEKKKKYLSNIFNLEKKKKAIKSQLNITKQNPHFSLPQIKAEISKLLLQTPTQASRECEIKSQISIS